MKQTHVERFEEAHYWWVVNEVVDLMREHGYNTVLTDINECLNPLTVVSPHEELKSDLKDEEQ